MIPAKSSQPSKTNLSSLPDVTGKRSSDNLVNIEHQADVKAQRVTQNISPINTNHQLQSSLDKIYVSEEIDEISIGGTFLNIQDEIEVFEQVSFKDILQNSKSCFIGVGQTVSSDSHNPEKKIIHHYLIQNIAEWIENPKKLEPLTRMPVKQINLYSLFKDESSADFFGSFEIKNQILSNACKVLIACFSSEDKTAQLVNWNIIAKIYDESIAFSDNQNCNKESKSLTRNKEKSEKIIKSIFEFNNPDLSHLSKKDQKLYIDFCSLIQIARLNKISENVSETNEFEQNNISPSDMVSVLNAIKSSPAY
ncbi:MAG: hypothetical protein V4629_08195 [Pseudomonadota bacterium]